MLDKAIRILQGIDCIEHIELNEDNVALYSLDITRYNSYEKGKIKEEKSHYK
jgi:Fe2+ transport system protein B